MLPTQEVLDRLAGRLEYAYGLRRPTWWRGCSTARVWFAAALRLWEAHAEDPAQIPLDAELFVASQPISAPIADPWSELAAPESARRYRSQIYQIVRRLRSELKREVARAERLILRGREIAAVLNLDDGRLSPLGCLIVAWRAGRADLANRFASRAAAQNRSCPLYRLLACALLPADFYPAQSCEIDHEVETAPRTEKILLSLN